MSFAEFEEIDLAQVRQELLDEIDEHAVPVQGVTVSTFLEGACLEVMAELAEDSLLPGNPTAQHRNTILCVRMFCISPETEEEVIWAQISYERESLHSHFFPVPPEYGDIVAIHFGWEFDRKTLAYGCAEVRDRDSVHYVSVLPNKELTAFVGCCAAVAERWSQ